jgi:hypothetical protein
MAIWYIWWSFGNFSPRFGMLYEEKSGNPARFALLVQHSVIQESSFSCPISLMIGIVAPNGSMVRKTYFFAAAACQPRGKKSGVMFVFVAHFDCRLFYDGLQWPSKKWKNGA